MPYPNMGRPMPAQYASPGAVPAINPGAFGQRNAIAQALMNVSNPPPQMPGVPQSFSGTAGPMPTAPPNPSAGPFSGSAGPMPTAPPNPSAAPAPVAGPAPMAGPAPGPVAPGRLPSLGGFGGR